MTPKDDMMSVFDGYDFEARMNFALIDHKKSPDHKPSIEALVNVMTDAVSEQSEYVANSVYITIIDWALRLEREDLIAQVAAKVSRRGSESVFKALAKALWQKTQHPRAWTDAEKAAFTDWDSW